MCDDVVGQVRNKLIEKGLYENTILVLTADNGWSFAPAATIPAISSAAIRRTSTRAAIESPA